MPGFRSTFVPPELDDDTIEPSGPIRVEKTAAGEVHLDIDFGTITIVFSPEHARQLGNALTLAAIGDAGFEVLL